MPTPVRIAAEVTVDAEPELIWRTATDWPRQREWIWATRVSGGRGPRAGVGGGPGVGPTGFPAGRVTTEWDPPHRCVLRHTGRVVRGMGTFEIATRGARSEFRWIEHIQLPVPPAIGAPAGRVVAPIAAWGLRSCLRRFARLFPVPMRQD